MDPKWIDDLARQLVDSVPQSLKNVRDEAEQNFKALLQSGLSRMDIVTREEYEVQTGVLRRTREKLEALERRIAELEREENSDS